MASPHRSPPTRRPTPDRESARITLARALELGVGVSWREASAIVHDAIAGARSTGSPGPARVTADSCLLTRGGDVVLIGTAAEACPDAIVPLLDDLLASCSDPGRFAGAVADGTALEMIEELGQSTSRQRRRVEVAAVALRALAAAADAARALVDAGEPDPAAAAGCTAPVAAVAPPPIRRPWPAAATPQPAAATPQPVAVTPRPAAVTPRPAAVTPRPTAATPRPTGPNIDGRTIVPRPPAAPGVASNAVPRAIAVSTDPDVRRRRPSRAARLQRGGQAVLVCLVFAAAGAWILMGRAPAIQRAAAEPSRAAVEPSPPAGERVAPASEPRATSAPSPPTIASAGREATAPAARPGLPADRSAPRAFPRIEGTPSVRPTPPPPPARNLAAEATAPALAVVPAEGNSAPAPAVAPSTPAARPGASASAPVETPVAGAIDGLDAADLPPVAGVRSTRLETETRAIETVLGRYRAAFNTLDAGAAVAVWPTMNERILARAFERLESHAVSFDRCQIEVFSVLAEAACSGSSRYVRKVGSRTPRHEARHWRFSLRKTGDDWLIDSVDAR